MKLRGKSEGFIVPSAPDGQHNRWGGKEPCSRRVSTREGLGDWREPGNSGHDPDTPEALGINAKLLQTFGMAVAGSPEQCIEALSKYRAAGVSNVLLAVGAGALPTEVVRESMECIAEEVMPAFEASDVRRQAS